MGSLHILTHLLIAIDIWHDTLWQVQKILKLLLIFVYGGIWIFYRWPCLIMFFIRSGEFHTYVFGFSISMGFLLYLYIIFLWDLILQRTIYISGLPYMIVFISHFNLRTMWKYQLWNIAYETSITVYHIIFYKMKPAHTDLRAATK